VSNKRSPPLPSRTPDNLPPPDDGQDPEFRIDMGALPESEPLIDDPQPDEAGTFAPLPVPAPPSPWSPNALKTAYTVGTGDCFLAEVAGVHDAAVDTQLAQKGILDVRRVGVHFNETTDAMALGNIQPAMSAPNPSLHKAVPFPMPDQRGYHAAEDDPVLILAGRDGRMYAIPDNNCFIGEVQVGTDIGAEGNVGANFEGAGNQFITVRRVLVSGDPTLAEGYSYHATRTAIIYPYVKVNRPGGQHHGHKPGTFVLCHRRGQYIYAEPGPLAALGMLTAAGPASEADFATNHYWVKIIALKAEYTAANANDWTEDNVAVVTEISWIVDAKNLAEGAAVHGLAAGTEVVLHLFANADDSNGHEHEPYWVFSHLDTAGVVADGVCINSTYSPQVPAGQVGPPAWTALPGWNSVPKTCTDATVALAGIGSTPYTIVKGEMYLDGSGKYNPWMALNLATTIANYLKANPGDVFCAGSASGTNLTGTDFYANGHMYTDGEGKVNPRILFKMPTTVLTSSSFCTGTQQGSLASGGTSFHVQGFMYTDGEGKLNPAFNLPDADDYLTLADDSTWIDASISGNTITVTHIGPGAAAYRTDSIGFCGVAWDTKGHVTGSYDKDGTYRALDYFGT
jgi:hypothetical protein